MYARNLLFRFRMFQCQLTSICVQICRVGPIQLHIVAVHDEHGNFHLPILAGNKHLHSIITRFQIRTAGALQQAFYGSPPICQIQCSLNPSTHAGQLGPSFA